MSSKKMFELDGVAATSIRDLQNESLSIEGADISELKYINDNHGKGFTNTIGCVDKSKKIFKEDDCEDERQKYFWNKLKSPYIYFKGRLFTDEEHYNAKAAAAILRNINKHDLPIKIKSSVEGSTLSRGEKDKSILERTKITGVALTFQPANPSTLVEPLTLEKSADPILDEKLIKSIVHLAKNDVPNFIDISNKIRMEKLAHNIERINTLLKDPELQKGIGNKIAALGMMASMAPVNFNINDQLKHEIKKPLPIEQKLEDPRAFVDKLKDTDPHMWALAQNESSGGSNMEHTPQKSGLHAGTQAGGPWGMMPNTLAEVFKKHPELHNKYSDVSVRLSNLKNDENSKYITDKLNKDPSFAHDVAKKLFDHTKELHRGNIDKTVHSWRYGVGNTINKDKKSIVSNDYVKKFRNNLASRNKINKALTAGFGGAVAPTNRTGGSVLQRESNITDGKLKYITCDNCGKEQVYFNNQVRCRNCGTSFNFHKLADAMKIG